MGWIADLVTTHGSDRNERISNLEDELDKFVADSSHANHQIIEEISDRTAQALETIDSISVGNVHYVEELLRGES